MTNNSNINNIFNNTNTSTNKDNKNNLQDDDFTIDYSVQNRIFEDNYGYRSNTTTMHNNFINSSQMMLSPWGDRFNANIHNDELMIKNNSKFIENSISNMFHPNTLKPKSSAVVDLAPIYNHTMHRNEIDNDCYLSTVAAEIIQVAILKILETILLNNELRLDFQENSKNKYEFTGRIYTSSVTEFIISIYKLKEKDDKNNISIIKIQNLLGDNFGFEEFKNFLLTKLENQKIINRNFFNSHISLEDFDSLFLDDEDDEHKENQEFDTLENSNNDDEEHEENQEFDFQLCEIILETLYKTDSYQEEYMHDTYQLACYLEKNNSKSKNMMNYLLKNESNKIIENLVKLIKLDHLKFSAFIVLYVLEIIKILLSHENIKSKLIIPKSFTRDIIDIHKIWTNQNGVETELGCMKIKFTRSQQIEKRCESILELIQ